MNSERELFEEWASSETGWDLYWSDHINQYMDHQTNGAWLSWQASAQRQGYKLVLLDHMSVIRDALVIACDSGKNYQRYEDSLNYVHKAMIGACDE